MPEGGGLLVRGLEPQINLKTASVLVVMVGYRNASYLLWERGQISGGETTELGFEKLLEKFIETTSGLKAEEAIAPICEAGRGIRRRALLPLVQAQGSEYRASELRQLAASAKAARAQCWGFLSNWLLAKKFPQVDEVILAGGTARYYRQELEDLFSVMSLNWGDRLEERMLEVIGPQRAEDGLNYRLTDVCGYFYYLQYLFIPTTPTLPPVAAGKA